jgi:hypothetical protein
VTQRLGVAREGTVEVLMRDEVCEVLFEVFVVLATIGTMLALVRVGSC